MAGGRSDTKEYCQICGKVTLHSIYVHSPGIIERKVMCKHHRKDYDNGKILSEAG